MTLTSVLEPGSRVLVTGVTGYIGAHVAHQFLKAGYVVIGTTRKVANAETLKNQFESEFGQGKFEIAEVADIETEGVFDELVKGVQGIAHVASPVVINDVTDPQHQVLNPARNGTLNILKAAHSHGKNVKNVVVTSSVASVASESVRTSQPGYVFTEEDWNDEAITVLKQFTSTGQTSPPGLAYVASKNEAERSLWKFKQENNPAFTLTTILPSFVLGPQLVSPKSRQDVSKGSSSAYLVNYVIGESTDPQQPPFAPFFVDVTDVARAHVLAVEQGEKANGQRYIASAGTFDFQRIVDYLREAYPAKQSTIAEGIPGKYITATFGIDGSKLTRDLGLVYTDLKTTTLNTGAQFINL
ncbi:NAD(P)-binding protein [Hesseltinella vesiculosa]|uniref:NAD(P)-binding protein n=1 Tax=Hesseltinella vesiculosa TaxID=101127 RepID=A0A1X2GLL8_9FUNG|nr:NAD(P)-binding protein [Hesseltinella vesiculosa]